MTNGSEYICKVYQSIHAQFDNFKAECYTFVRVVITKEVNSKMNTIRLLLMFTAVTAAVFVVGSGVMAREGLEYPGTGRFGDDDGSVHEASIEAMAYNGIMEGCNLAEALFCPSAMVSRAQFAAFLDRALDLPETDTDFFADDDDNPYEESINRVASAKITLGCGVDSYCPDRLITRAQMATLLVNAIPRLAPVDNLQNYFSRGIWVCINCVPVGPRPVGRR